MLAASVVLLVSELRVGAIDGLSGLSAKIIDAETADSTTAKLVTTLTLNLNRFPTLETGKSVTVSDLA